MLRDGFYTIVGFHAHYTFRLRTQKPDATFAPGKQVIAYLRGPVNTSDYTKFGFVDGTTLKVWRRFETVGMKRIINAAQFLLDGKADDAGKNYALASGNCYVCNRLLTTPESVALGIGPICAGRESIAS